MVQDGFTVWHPVRIHKIVHVDPIRVRFCHGYTLPSTVGALNLRGFHRYSLFQWLLEDSKHRAEFEFVEDNFDSVEGLVCDSLRRPIRFRDRTFLCSLMHVNLESIHECLNADERRDSVGPSSTALVHIDMRQEKMWDDNAILDGSEMLTKLRRKGSFVLVQATLSDWWRGAIEQLPPRPEMREDRGR